ncbi:hypothetical protein LCGC14_2802360 [marine sediment metagenome]|uniref:Uncharacterized protein n=1 Tax=marine sediment metagenome TaxID=412755 RepID=A0A0F8YMB8_9ZZZZ
MATFLSENLNEPEVVSEGPTGDIFSITAEATSGSGHEVDVATIWGELF